MTTPQERSGLTSGIVAYVLWGLFPLYFILLKPSGPIEVVAHRATWTLVFCLAVLVITRRVGQLSDVFADRKRLVGLSIAGLLVAGNWVLYIFGVNTGRTLDAALGYFITPLTVTALGVVVLRERLRPLQWLAVGIGAAAVIVLMVAYGQFPWIALGLAASFSTYSLVKKLVGATVPPVPGLATETLAILPLSLGYLLVLNLTGHGTVDALSPYGALIALSGVVTAIPLLLFAYAATRLSMVSIGMIQYIAPLAQFLVGWLVFHEPMPPARWAGFALVWLALVVFVTDALSAQRSRTPS